MKTRPYQAYIILAALLAVFGSAAKAQKATTRPVKDTSSSRMAADLAISKSRAVQIRSALNYKHAEISKLMRDSSISPAEKHLRFKQLVMERRRRIDSLITPAEKQKLKQVYGETTPKQQEHLAKIRQRQEAEMNRNIHVKVPKNILKDSTHVLLKPTN